MNGSRRRKDSHKDADGITVWVMAHIWISCATHMNESCHTYEWVMSHIWMSHVTHMNESCHRNDSCKDADGITVWVMSHIWMSCATHMNESCHTYEWVVSQEWQLQRSQWNYSMGHVTHINKSCDRKDSRKDADGITVCVSRSCCRCRRLHGVCDIPLLCMCRCVDSVCVSVLKLLPLSTVTWCVCHCITVYVSMCRYVCVWVCPGAAAFVDGYMVSVPLCCCVCV